jgi:hypothetical protein
VIRKNETNRNFRIFGPDEAASNRLHAVFEATSKQWMEEYSDGDDNLAQDGRVVEMLCEHQCHFVLAVPCDGVTKQQPNQDQTNSEMVTQLEFYYITATDSNTTFCSTEKTLQSLGGGGLTAQAHNFH